MEPVTVIVLLALLAGLVWLLRPLARSWKAPPADESARRITDQERLRKRGRVDGTGTEPPVGGVGDGGPL